jgi:hypothetical protein
MEIAVEEEITNALHGVAGGRRFWVRAPQSTALPYVVMQRISGIRDYVTSGPSGYVQSRVQFDVYASTYGTARTTARALVAALSGHSGGTIQGIFIDSERDLPASDTGEVSHLFRVSIDAAIHHGE